MTAPHWGGVDPAQAHVDPDQGARPRRWQAGKKSGANAMTASPTPARWPLFNLLSQWARAAVPVGERDFLGQDGEEAQRLRAHLRASPADLRWLAGRDPGHSELLPHMLWAAGLDEGRLATAEQAVLARTCRGCTIKAHCAEELVHNRAADSYVGFCPNALSIKALRGETPSPS
jgi:hypothetical protein